MQTIQPRWINWAIATLAVGWVVLLAWSAFKLWEAWSRVGQRWWTGTANLVTVYGVFAAVLVWVVSLLWRRWHHNLSREAAASCFSSPLIPGFVFALYHFNQLFEYWWTLPLFTLGYSMLLILLERWLMSRVLVTMPLARDLKKLQAR